MFEFNIVDGMPVHKTVWKEKDGNYVQNQRGMLLKVATGEVVWKLAFKCITCGTLSEECYCYSDRDAMIKDREEHKNNWHCSLDCSIKGKTPEEQKAWINEQRRWFYKQYHGNPPFVKWWDINEVIDFIQDHFDGEPWFPEGSDQECPV